MYVCMYICIYDMYVYTITCVCNKIHVYKYIYTSSTNSTGPKCGGQV